MFKLFPLSIGQFAIVKTDKAEPKLPISVHGFLHVFEDSSQQYFALLEKEMMSKELFESDQLYSLKEEAIHLTEEAVADEIGSK